MRQHASNEALRDLLREAGWTHEKLARAINAIAGENNVDLCYDRTAVAHWLAGVAPRPLTRGYILEAFSRQLHRLVTPGEAGLEPAPRALPSAAVVVRSSGSGAAMLRELCAAILDERLRSRTLAQPYRGEPRLLLSAADTAVSPRPCIAERVVEDPRSSEISKAVATFGAGLLGHGGAFAPATCAMFLAERVVPYLAQKSQSEASLAAGASRLTHLLGDMYADDLRHGVAQQCYQVSVQLARDAPEGEEALLVLIRAGLQASELAVDSVARQLVHAAAGLAGTESSPAVQAAVLVGSAAREAACGARDAARHSLHLVEKTMRSAWAAQEHFDSVEADLFAVSARHWGKVHMALGDQLRASQVWQLSLSHVPTGQRYVRALLHAELGALHIQLGDWRRASVAWEAFVQLYPVIDSRRAHRALLGLDDALRRRGNQPETCALRARIGPLLRHRRSQFR
jgi:hypothetical protein